MVEGGKEVANGKIGILPQRAAHVLLSEWPRENVAKKVMPSLNQSEKCERENGKWKRRKAKERLGK